MDLATMRQECRLIINEPDSSNSHFSDIQLTAWANEAYRFAVTRLSALPVKERDYTSAASITLNSNTLSIERAYHQNPDDITQYFELPIKDLDWLSEFDSNWLGASTGIPRFLVRKDTFTGILYPPPDSDHASLQVRCYSLEMPTALSGDTDTPLLPMNIQDIFPHYMAYRCFQQINRPDLAERELLYTNGQLKSQRELSTRFTKQNYGFKWTDSDDTAS